MAITHRTTKLSVERLESRALLSVSANLAGSNLVIKGDADADAVAVVQLASDVANVGAAGDIVVISDSPINGGANNFVTFASTAGVSPIKQIHATLGAGNNVFLLGDTTTAGTGGVTTAGIVALQDEIANVLGLNDSTVVAATTSSLNALKTVSVTTGVGDDAAAITGVTATRLSINAGKGNNTIGLTKDTVTNRIDVLASNGNDNLNASTVTAGTFNIKLSTGNNTVALAALTLGHNLSVALGAGDNTVTLDGSTIGGNLSINVGGRRSSTVTTTDSLTLSGTTTVGHNASLLMGRGNNTLIVGGTFTVANHIALKVSGASDQVTASGVSAKNIDAAILGLSDTIAVSNLNLTGRANVLGTKHAVGTFDSTTFTGGGIVRNRGFATWTVT